MKLKDLLEQYGEYDIVLSKREATNEIMIEGRKPKPKTVWDLEKGDRYSLETDTGVVLSCELRYVDTFEKSREVGNIFLTREEAEKDVERRKVETLLIKHGGRRWFNGYNHNFHIGLDEYEEHLKAYILMTPTQGTIYFDTSARAEKAIYEIGEERIKKALFEVR